MEEGLWTTCAFAFAEKDAISHCPESTANPEVKCVLQLAAPGANGCEQLVDDGGTASSLKHRGIELEAAFGKDGTLPDPKRHHEPIFHVRLAVVQGFYLFGNHQVDADGKSIARVSLRKRPQVFPC